MTIIIYFKNFNHVNRIFSAFLLLYFYKSRDLLTRKFHHVTVKIFSQEFSVTWPTTKCYIITWQFSATFNWHFLDVFFLRIFACLHFDTRVITWVTWQFKKWLALLPCVSVTWPIREFDIVTWHFITFLAAILFVS